MTRRWMALVAVSLLMGCPDGGDASADGEDETGGDASGRVDGDDDDDDTPDGTGGGDDDDDDDDDDDNDDDDDDDAAVNWHEHMAPIIIGTCSGCHRDGGIAPFSFETYDEAAPFAPAMEIVVAERTMPPFGAQETDDCAPALGWRDDPRLTDDEIALFAAWADAGAPEGDPELAAEITPPPPTDLEDPDLVVPIGTAVEIEGAQDRFICFSLDPGLAEDRYISALQVIAGNDAVVHHVLIYEDETGMTADDNGPDGWYECNQNVGQGTLIAGWAPGGAPTRMPDGVGRLIESTSRIVLNVHYHPTAVSTEIDDATAVEFEYFDGVPEYIAGYQFFGNVTTEALGLLPGPNDEGGVPQFRIPAGVSDHTEEMRVEVYPTFDDAWIYRMGAHMHYLGVDMQVRVERADGSDECLLNVPTFDFNWQRGYFYDADVDEMPSIGPGDHIYLRCEYDNTLSNPGVVQALQDQGLDKPVDVYYGDGTLDEMCLGTFGTVRPNFQ